MRDTPASIQPAPSLLAGLDQLARIVEASGVGAIDPETRRRSESRALALTQAGTGEVLGAQVSEVAFAAALLSQLTVDLAADIAAARRLIGELERSVGVPAIAVGHELLRISHVSQLPPPVALHVQLSLLLIFTQAEAAWLWTRPAGEQARLVGQAGNTQAARLDVAGAAHRMVDPQPGQSVQHVDGMSGLAIERPQRPPSALILYSADRAAATNLLLEVAAPVVGATLDRLEMLAAEAMDEPAVISALERRLARLRYDLHDGPQQDLHLLGLDLRLFRDQLAPVIHGQTHADKLLGRLDDLEAQLVALDSELRHIATSMQSPFLPAGTLPDALQAVTEAFASRTEIQPEVDLSGDLIALSDSQQITLLALVREGLNNIQKHSDARRVTITIAAHDRGVDAQITDDGRGFDPEQTLVQAAREGHLGVVGIHERVRMLGGHARVESRPGGPTVISVTLPAWVAGRT